MLIARGLWPVPGGLCVRERRGWTLLCALLVIGGGCGASEPAGGDGAVDDGGVVDAAVVDDGGNLLPDGAADGGLPCRANGVMGVCVDISQCTGTRTAGLCPGPASIQCCTPRSGDGGANTCDPAAMPLPNTGRSEAAGQGGCPAGMVRVTSFCIDKYEASLTLVSGGEWSPYWNPGTRAVRAVSRAGAVPQGYINGRQAADACAAAGKRLCTDTEWLRACRGPTATTYPYGNTRMPGVCNDARAQHPAVEYFGTSDPSVFSMIDHPCLNQLPNSLDLAGENAGCISAEGALDMMGNLHEWTADPNGTFRGGFYVDTYRNGNGCLYATTAHDTGHWDYSTGFRCCASVP